MASYTGYVPTGIMVYNGSTFPALSGKVIFASFNFQSLYVSTLTGSLDSVDFTVPWAFTTRVTSLQQGSDGNIYALRYGFTGDGAILKISPPVEGIASQNEPLNFELLQNYPNPFNPATSISFTLAANDLVNIKVFDMTGREIAVILNENKIAGSYSVEWNAGNHPSGVYFYRMTTTEGSVEKKMVLVK
jgi:Secretion system C-terminal sorting domain/Glucose / Sorbosone dehydrogenase